MSKRTFYTMKITLFIPCYIDARYPQEGGVSGRPQRSSEPEERRVVAGGKEAVR